MSARTTPEECKHIKNDDKTTSDRRTEGGQLDYNNKTTMTMNAMWQLSRL